MDHPDEKFEGPLKRWWRDNQHIIQPCGILTGVGALMLGIPEASLNQDSLETLLTLKFFWLLLIGISTIVMFFTLIPCALEIKKKSFWLSEVAMDCIIGIQLVFAILLFKYTFHQYRNIIDLLLNSDRILYRLMFCFVFLYPLTSIAGGVSSAISNKFAKKRNLWGFIFFILIIIVVLSPIYIYQKITFDQNKVIENFQASQPNDCR